MKLLRLSFVLLLAAGLIGLAAAQAVRPQVGKPLQQAADLLRAGKARDALARVGQADKVPDKTPHERLTIERMRGAAAQRAGDAATAVSAFEWVFASGQLSRAEQAQVAHALVFAHAQLKQWAPAQAWARKARELGGDTDELRRLMAWVQAQAGDYAAVLQDAAAAVAAAERAGRRPDEDELLRLADAAQRMGDDARYAAALENLVHHHPKKEYWNASLVRVQRKPGFAQRLALDVMRLKRARGLLTTADEYMEMAQLALQAGLPVEGMEILEQGFAAGILGAGSDAGRHARLRALAQRQREEAAARQPAEAAAQARDGDALVRAGYAYVTMGEPAKGIAMIERGIAKGALRRPEEARLRLGMALLQSGDPARALQVLRDVQGTDGTADIARLWMLHAGAPARAVTTGALPRRVEPKNTR